MSKRFRDWHFDQRLLLPPSVQDFVAADHLARFVVALVRDALELSAIYAAYAGEKGQPPYDPTMMTALLLYGYAVGVYSSRRIARACQERVDFMAIVALDPPDFRTISDFRKRHLEALKGLFVQVLRLCERAGLVQLGHVALDGSKIKANASRHKAMSYARMVAREQELAAVVGRWLDAAATADGAEDRQFGTDQRGDALPAWVADKAKRLAKLREAKAALEAEAKAAAAAQAKHAAAAAAKRQAAGRRKPGKKAQPPSGAPAAKAQRNFTDPDSRVLLTRDGFIQGYNAQAAVDAKAQVIVAQALTSRQSDHDQLTGLLDGIASNLGRNPKEVSADSGFCSEANLAALQARGIAGYVAVARAKHPAQAKRTILGPLTQAMQRKLKRAGWRSRYRLRKQIVEPVFGQIKAARGFRQFLLRGIEKVKAEWAMLCTAHNLLKLAKATA
ncbi:MAG: IS1182 family transposase [Burkholderiales bacterium]